MHLRTGNKFEYNVKDEYWVRSQARTFCMDWRDGEDVLGKLVEDYFNTESNDDKTPDPVSTKTVLDYLIDMEKKNEGLPTFEKHRKEFTDFLSYVVKIHNLEKLRRKLFKAIEFAKTVYGEDYYRDVQAIFRQELDHFERTQ